VSVDLDQAKPRRPRGFNVLTRTVFVHQVFSLAVLGVGLSSLLAKANNLHALSTGAGLVIAVATAIAMFGVAKHKSLPSLGWLRVLLWAAVIRGSLSVLTLFGTSDAAIANFVRSMIVNEGLLIPLAIYWSRAAHRNYLVSFRAL